MFRRKPFSCLLFKAGEWASTIWWTSLIDIFGRFRKHLVKFIVKRIKLAANRKLVCRLQAKNRSTSHGLYTQAIVVRQDICHYNLFDVRPFICFTQLNPCLSVVSQWRSSAQLRVTACFSILLHNFSAATVAWLVEVCILYFQGDGY